ncbi:MAG: hypothetical protein HC792_01950 [Acaryochloridaceae cyanobacterium CSU_5_19]|nr:hypothetical protein [Acaryochloridaceae cyanobacterium CSU_5_19]
MESLSQFQDQRIVPAMLQGLQDVNAEVRIAAISGLSYLHPLVTDIGLCPVTLLEPMLQDLRLSVCQAAALALGRLGTDSAIRVLGNAVQGHNMDLALQIYIVQALGHSNAAASLPYLQQLWLDADSLKLGRAIIKAIGQMDGSLSCSATEILLSFLERLSGQEPEPILYQEIANALGCLKGETAVPALIQLLAQPDIGVRLHAIAALKQINPAPTHLQLQSLAEERLSDPSLQAGIAFALQEW